eukprot:TRINITY_DN20944_c0_g1_i1.p1 TRINITY_DN20944_c0_g1~~TRINITY_DN20944_c0_g1_i1.p1  ORF type:complete len:105 (+),score=19.42 TRINITY_DN20944_c0_g1_i1:48-362(+)
MVNMLFFFFKQKTAYEMLRSLVGSEMCIRDRSHSCPLVGPSPDLAEHNKTAGRGCARAVRHPISAHHSSRSCFASTASSLMSPALVIRLLGCDCTGVDLSLIHI